MSSGTINGTINKIAHFAKYRNGFVVGLMLASLSTYDLGFRCAR